VEQNRWADDAPAVEEKEGEGGGEGEKRIPRSRKVVVRDDYVDRGDDIFLVDREFALGHHAMSRGLLDTASVREM